MIRIPVDLTNPGQFFACCGLFELADRLWPGVEAWFEAEHFSIGSDSVAFVPLMNSIRGSRVTNTMTPAQLSRLEFLTSLPKRQRQETSGFEEEKKELESLRREEPIIFSGNALLRIDWFHDDDSGGSRLKTWAGQQSVLDIASAMNDGIHAACIETEPALWTSKRGTGLPFNFDSDIGGQGSALDIGFSFDPLSASETTRIEGTCKPALELLGFIGLQRFRPRELVRQNRFIYVAWNQPLPIAVASAVVCMAVPLVSAPAYEFRLLYRTKYLKSFLPAQPFQGEINE